MATKSALGQHAIKALATVNHRTADKIIEGTAFVATFERRNLELFERLEGLEHAKLNLLRHEPGEDFAVGVRQAGEEKIDRVLIGQ